MASEEIEQQLRFLREDYARLNGRPFDHFFCPILCKDEETELCMGHIVNQTMPNSRRTCVLQRKDVDGWFGKVFEPDFVTLIKYKGTGLREALTNPELGKKFKPRFTVEGEDCKYHHYRGGPRPPEQCGLILEDQSGEVVRLVLHKSPQEIAASQGKKWQISVEADCRVSALVSLIKAAYLTLFRLLGYRYALSAAGLSVGYGILGDFYRDNREKGVQEVKEAARSYFQQYVHMMRPIEKVDGVPPLGTIEDHRTMACFGSSGRPFAFVVCVRTNQELHAVLMPAFVHPDSVAAYHEFLHNDRESLRAHECVLDPQKMQWDAYDSPIEMMWPKESGTFELD